VKTHDIPAVAAAASVDRADLALMDRWQREFDDLVLRIGARFVRVEPRRRVAAFLTGLLAELPRRNCWTIAEHAGEHDPRGMQRLLSQAVWDEDGVRDDLRDYVSEHLGDGADGHGAVLVVDETGDVKKGTATVAVQRQYTGTAGRIENSQVAVYLTYAAASGYAFIDRELYLPTAWTEDADRRQAAGVPTDVEFATKPTLARAMIDRAVAAGIPAGSAAGDEVYGADPALRKALAGHGLGFVLAVAKSHRFTTGIGSRRAIDLAVRLPATAWQRISAGAGAKGPRWYDWALIEVADPALTSSETSSDTSSDTSSPVAVGTNWLLVRRRISDGEYAFYRAHAPGPVPLAELVRVAGVRWQIEESFAGGKELTALDEHQVRNWTSWRRWTVLAMLAHAFLSVMTATQPATTSAEPADAPARQPALIPLTRNEIRRLLTTAMTVLRTLEHRLHWSQWRRRHQAVARASHYRRRTEQQA
jgi:SRSO17 transposase